MSEYDELGYAKTKIAVKLEYANSIEKGVFWFPRLLQAKKEQLENWELLGDGEGIHWPALDEDLSVAGLLAGTH